MTEITYFSQTMNLQCSYFKKHISSLQDIFPHIELEEVLAHKREEDEEIEILPRHLQRTLNVFCRYIKKNQLEPIINKLIRNIYDSAKIEDVGYHDFKEIIWSCLINSIYLHDIGKVNKKFQRKKMNNHSSLRGCIDFNDTKHSRYAKYFIDFVLFEKYFKTIQSDKSKIKIFYIIFILTSIVDRHHSPLMNIDKLLESHLEYMENKDSNIINWFRDGYPRNVSEISLIDFMYSTKEYIRGNDLPTNFHSNDNLFYLYKLLYSLLIISDYYATHCFKQNIHPENIEFNTIDEKTIKEIQENFFSNKSYNKDLLDVEFIKEIKQEKPKEIDDIDRLRTKILIEASENLNDNLGHDNRIFFLNVPTGGGKTNISMKLLIDILTNEYVTNIKKAYYIFPYINIIEQNYKSIQNNLSSEDNKIVSQIYSYNEWDFSLEEEDEELEHYANQMFLNFPISVISNTNFFNTFLKNGKKINYKIANLANSVVILDEIQTLPNHRWKFFSELLTNLASKLNIYFIVMSATLPDLSRFLDAGERKKFVDLIENPNIYQNHQVFMRNRVNFTNITNPKSNEIIKKIQKNKEIFDDDFVKVLFVTNTIRDSYTSYEFFKENLDDFDVYLLNSTILSPRRKEIIDLFDKKLENLDNNCLLVSTQSVEAGIDIDCQFGFREIAPLDSIEQICGRINREKNIDYSKSNVYIFDLDTYDTVYKKDRRLKVQMNMSPDEIKEYLNNKEFSKYYNRVIDYLNKDEHKGRSRIYNEFINPMQNLWFKKLSRRDYIETENITFFLPNMDIIKEFGKDIISSEERDYLKKFGLDVENGILGSDVWDVYKDINSNKKNDSLSFLESKKLQSVLNKFTFSVVNKNFNETTLRQEVQRDIDIDNFESIGGIIRVNKEFVEQIDYDPKKGLNPEKMKSHYTVYLI